MSAPFTGMDPAGRAFYSKLFANVLLNLNAVQMGIYPMYISEMSDGHALHHWYCYVPQVAAAIRKMRESGEA